MLEKYPASATAYRIKAQLAVNSGRVKEAIDDLGNARDLLASGQDQFWMAQHPARAHVQRAVTDITEQLDALVNRRTPRGIDRVAVACLLAVSMLVGSTPTARAECVRIPLRVSKQRAGLMFSGVVTSIQALTAGRVIVTFEVDQAWKGPIHRVTTIYQWMEPEAGPYEKGARYLVIAPRYALLDFSVHPGSWAQATLIRGQARAGTVETKHDTGKAA